jgi:LysM repeat protein
MATAGDNVYYTLDVKRLTGDFNYQPPQSSSVLVSQQDPTQPVIGSIVVATPNNDGSIVHIIQYGETLVDIAQAYGISLNDLISMNKLDPNKPVYYAKQPLIIRLAFTATPYMTATFTPRPPTRTPLATRTPRPTRTATPFHTAVPTRTNTAEPLVQLPTLNELGPARPIMAYVFIGISVVGLLVLISTAFGPGKKG